MGWWRRLAGRLSGGVLPESFTGRLGTEEHVLAVGRLADGGHVVATSLGLWLPEAGGDRLLGWHLISKATWGGGTLAVVEAEQWDTAGSAVLLRDLPVRRIRLADPGRVPVVVRQRVTGSIRSSHRRELPGGGAWFVQRKVPGQDGIVLQVRVDEGTKPGVVRAIAEKVAATVDQVRDQSEG